MKASEARELSDQIDPEPPNDNARYIMEEIGEAASEGKTEIRVSHQTAIDTDKYLRKLGYAVVNGRPMLATIIPWRFITGVVLHQAS